MNLRVFYLYKTVGFGWLPINQAGGQKGFAFLTTCFLIIQPVLWAVFARNIRRRWLFAPICI